MASGQDRLDALKPHFLALSVFEQRQLVQSVRNDRTQRKVRPRELKAQKRVAVARVEKLAAALKTVRSEWLPLLLKENE